MDSGRKVLTNSSSAGRPTLMRKNAFGKNTVRHVVNGGDPFRIDGDDDRVTDILNSIGISRPDMLGISEDAWRERMVSGRPASCELQYDRHPEADLSSRNTGLTSRTRSLDISRSSTSPEPEPPAVPPRRMSSDELMEERSSAVLSRKKTADGTTNYPTRMNHVRREFQPRDDVQRSEITNAVVTLRLSEDSNGGGGGGPAEDKGRSFDSQMSEMTDSMSHSSDSIESQSTLSMSEPEEVPLSARVLTPRLSSISWKMLNLLGTGSFGAVYRAVGSDGNFFAVKEVSLSNSDDQSVSQLQQEIAVLSQCQHENVVQYLGTQRADNMLYIFLELMTQGSLVSQYKEYPLFDEQLRSYTRQILKGLSYLHDRKVVHRDIKCANILVHAHGTVKLADFGMAKELDMIQSMKSSKGSPYWMAPEVVHPKKTASFPADIWSLGCTILEMATRKPPFSEHPWNTVLWKVGHGEVPPIPDTLPQDAQDFIAQCLQVEPSNRPTAKKLLSHPFVTLPLSSQSSENSEVSYERRVSFDEETTPSSWRTMSRGSVHSVRTRRSIYDNQ